MENFHAVAALLVAGVMGALSFFDDFFIKDKLIAYLQPRVNRGSLAPEAVETIKNIASGASLLVAFSANAIVFVINIFLAVTLFQTELQRMIYVMVLIPVIGLVIYGLFHVMTRFDLADIPVYLLHGRTISSWLRWTQIGFIAVTLVCFSLGLVSRSIPSEH